MTDPPDRTTRSAYIDNFQGGDRQEEALRVALDIRKFEIELYWKRATYFWTFIAAALGGYFLVQIRGSGNPFESAFVITCLGFVFSLAWYFVNRGSKTWQRNWETQVDLLEDEIIGPLYKSGLNRYTTNFWRITDGYPFSPSKINQLLGLFVTVVWAGLMVRTLFTADWGNVAHVLTAIVSLLLSGMTCLSFWWLGRTKESDEVIRVHHRQRRYDDDG